MPWWIVLFAPFTIAPLAMWGMWAFLFRYVVAPDPEDHDSSPDT